MKFKKIELKNFRQFKDEVELVFSTDDEKNLTVIHAMNGAGKTTLTQAFRWCLYEELNLPNKKELLNAKVFMQLAEGESDDVQVRVEFEHQNKLYTAVRKQKITKKNTEQKASESAFELQYQDQYGQTKFLEGEQALQQIEAVLSRGLANYAFFDGERIKNLGSNTKSAQVEMKNAIYMIFNITTYEMMLNRLKGKVRNNVLSKIVQTTDSAAEFNLLEQEINQLEAESNSLVQQVKQDEERLDEIKQQLRMVSQQIIKYTEVKNLEKDIQNNKAIIEENENTIAALLGNTKQRDTQAIRKVFTNYVVTGLFQSQYRDIQPALLKHEQQKIDINQLIPKELVTQLLQEDSCICGTKINESMKMTLSNLEKLLPLLNIGNQLTIWKTKANSKNEQYLYLEETVTSELARLSKLQDVNEQLNEENKRLNKQIGTFVQVTDLTQRREDYEAQEGHVLEKIAKNKAAMDINLKKRQEIQKDLNALAKKHQVNGIEEKKLNLIDQIILQSNKRMNALKARVHKDLQERVNEIFTDVAHKGTKMITINPETYDYTICDQQTKSQSLSEGEEVITSLSFIAAIISVAKSVAKGGNEQVNSEMPLVLDAPFAKLDSIHLNKIAPVLPEIADQVILFTVDQQFKTQAEEVLKTKIGIQYTLENSGDQEITLTKIQ